MQCARLHSAAPHHIRSAGAGRCTTAALRGALRESRARASSVPSVPRGAPHSPRIIGGGGWGSEDTDLVNGAGNSAVLPALGPAPPHGEGHTTMRARHACVPRAPPSRINANVFHSAPPRAATPCDHPHSFVGQAAGPGGISSAGTARVHSVQANRKARKATNDMRLCRLSTCRIRTSHRPTRWRRRLCIFWLVSPPQLVDLALMRRLGCPVVKEGREGQPKRRRGARPRNETPTPPASCGSSYPAGILPIRTDVGWGQVERAKGDSAIRAAARAGRGIKGA